MRIKSISFFFLSVLALMTTRAEETVDRNDPKFVTASVLIAEPGNDLCAYLGHACIRLECPTYKLDYCYSYECEGIMAHPFRFLAGDLKMGMFATPTEEYLSAYREEKRGVRQFALNLPPPVKQRLWQVLDRLVEKGANIPYDPLKKSCAVSMLRVIAEACKPQKLGISRWPFELDETMRGIVRNHSGNYDWHRAALSVIFGTAADEAHDPFDKVILPCDLLAVLQNATLGGEHILAKSSVQLVPMGPKHERAMVTPMMVSVVLAAVGIISVFFPHAAFDGLFLAIHGILGFAVMFLVIGSTLPLNPWNWLIVPYNLLPILFWKWRRYWMLTFAAVLAVWCGVMIIAPHGLTEGFHIVLVGGSTVWYIGSWARIKRPRVNLNKI